MELSRITKSKLRDGESGDDGGFRAQDVCAQGGFGETGGAGGGKFGVGPAAFGADGEEGRSGRCTCRRQLQIPRPPRRARNDMAFFA